MMSPLSCRVVLCRLSACCLYAAAFAANASSAPEAPAESVVISMLREEAARQELGQGVDESGPRAATLYCEAARLGDIDSQFRLGWMYANGTGVERSDSVAAFFFQIAAEQGLEQAQHMLRVVGGPTTEVPDCMREPTRQAAKPAATSSAKVAEWKSSGPPTIVNLVNRIAPEYRVPPRLALAIIEAESNFDVAALSPKNAKGLMQLIPGTAARFN
ncbi:MAG TPA: transglycosylase SLT domain-containing protein, partial [Albitalea sp.]|nr:transglycosylase SLT domain-containing protein [Albitalea sp.]